MAEIDDSDNNNILNLIAHRKCKDDTRINNNNFNIKFLMSARQDKKGKKKKHPKGQQLFVATM